MFTRRDLEEAAGQAAGAAAGICLPDDRMMPSEELSAAVDRVLGAVAPQAGDLIYAASQLDDLIARAPEGNELESLKVTARWLDRTAQSLGTDAITAIPPER